MNEIAQWLQQLHYLSLPILGGIGVALIAGPLGVFMIWRRLAYFGDTLSHSGLLGITLALACHINVTVGVCAVAIVVALLLLKLQSRLKVASDTILGFLSHTSLALGLLLLSIWEEIRVDVLGFLYGDILAMTNQDLLLIYVGVLVVLGSLVGLWQPLLRVTLSEELAQVEGVKVTFVQAIYLILLAIVVAIGIKVVGVLLITALLVIPAASARAFAKNPESMAVLASVSGIFSVVLGMGVSHHWDVPTGPAIVVCAAGIFLLTVIFSRLKELS